MRGQTRPVLETLESRRLLSSVLPDPIAQPLDVATPLDGTLANGTSTPSGLTPSQLRDAYGIENIKLNGITGDGTGQTIAIVVADDDPALVNSTASNFDQSDLHIFDQEFGLPDPPSFTKVEQFPGQMTVDTGWAEEADLDVEWSHAIAPKASIVLVEAGGDGAVQLLNYGAETAASISGVSVVSMSFGFGEFPGENVYDQEFHAPSGHNPVTFVASTGDNGAPGDYPAFSPNVVAVGGTDLTVSSSGAYESETGYDAGGGGISESEYKPSFQSSVTQSETFRTTPDVSIDANPQSGVDVYDSFNGGYANKWYRIGGTSLSAPVWAGLIAIADQGRVQAKMSTLDGVTQTLPKLYSLSSSDYHDITSGNNGFSAEPGYDLVTGRGSPIANLLVPALAGVPSGSTSTNTASISGFAFVDSNGNGDWDSGEKGLAGVKVYIDVHKDGKLDSGDPEVTTGSNGAYTFSGLAAGTYVVREVVPSGYKLTGSGVNGHTLTLSTGSKSTNDNFGNEPQGTISGYVYFDKNDDQKYDSGDSSLAGVQLFIDTNKNGKHDEGEYEVTSNYDGYYDFTGLAPGVYRVVEIVPSGYHLSVPSKGYTTITVGVGSDITGENWGNLK